MHVFPSKTMGNAQDTIDKVSNTWILTETEPEKEMVVLLEDETRGSVYQEKFEYPLVPFNCTSALFSPFSGYRKGISKERKLRERDQTQRATIS